ncbi:MAG: CPXCG motif-containing cysteine-rich protein [Pseudohongiellaceae bacterium]
MTDLVNEEIFCPYCGEPIEVTIEVLQDDQEYIEDCQVCCRPIVFTVAAGVGGGYSVSVRSENDTF